MRASVTPTYVFLSDGPPDPMLGDKSTQAVEVITHERGDEHPIALVLGGVRVYMTPGVARELAERLAKVAR